MPPGDQQGLLDRVLSLSGIIDHRQGQPQEPFGMWSDDGTLEGGFLGALGGHRRDGEPHRRKRRRRGLLLTCRRLWGERSPHSMRVH
jgi:hypothetical protein